MNSYDDIINMPYPRKPQRMSNYDRAAQFAPFSALTGYEEAIHETARLTESAVELADDEISILNEKLRTLEPGQRVEAVYYQNDSRKAGGAHIRYTGSVKKVDANAAALVMDDGTVIPFGSISRICTPD